MNEDVKKEKQLIMKATFRATLMNGETLTPYLIGGKGYVDIGGFEVSVPGYQKPIPFDFEATAGTCNKDGSYSYGNWEGFLERIYDVNPCHEEDWSENGLKRENITAKLLASAERLEEFYFNVCDENDNTIPCFLEVQKMCFWDEKDMCHSIQPAVLKNYNRLRVAEQLAELMQPKKTYLERKPFLEETVKCMQDSNPKGILEKIVSLQKADVYNTDKRALADFLVDCMLEVSESKKDIYRMALTAYDNPVCLETAYSKLFKKGSKNEKALSLESKIDNVKNEQKHINKKVTSTEIKRDREID